MRRKWVVYVNLVLFVVVIGGTAFAAAGETIWVSFIDVGQGDSILVQDGNGFDVLIDGGDTHAGDEVLAYLRKRNVDDIDVMLATHGHADHIGGLIDVLEADDIPVERVLYNGYPYDTQTWGDFVDAVGAEGLVLEATHHPEIHSWGGITAYTLHPLPGMVNPDQNDASVAILIDHGDVEFLLMADVGTPEELEVASRGESNWIGPACCAEVLKVGHHGSNDATSADFLAVVQPDEAVITSGDQYGHPTAETLEQLADSGVEVWRMDQFGTVYAISDGIGVKIQYFLERVFLPLVR